MKNLPSPHRVRSVFAALLLALSTIFVNAQDNGVVTTSANVYGVTSANQLVRFNTATPGTVTTVGPITGLQGGENVVGIDFRPATGELFAVGSNSRLYVVNKSTAAASFVAALSTALSGARFGVDFNPTVDRLRIVSNTGQNLRVNPVNGAAIVDGVLNGAATGADAAGYTNSFNGSTATTLYDISAATDTLYTQNPPNNGTLVTVGALGVNVVDINGFDILSADGTALAAFTTAAAPLTGLYTINLTTGAATSVGQIGNGLASLSGFAVEIGFAANSLAYGVTTGNGLIQFNTVRPNTILRSTAITGLQPGEDVVGIDFRPVTGQLFALGSTSRLYVIDPFTAVATQVGSGQFSVLLNGTSFGVDFNPTVDRIRVVSNTGQNLRLNPITGAVVTPPDTNLNGAATGADAAAYTNNFAGSTVTTLYDISSSTDTLYLQGGLNGSPSPNLGTLTTVGALGVNTSAVTGFDITANSNKALAAFQTGSTNSSLYTIDLTTGSAAIVGPIGGGVGIRSFAVARNTTANSSATTIDYDGDGKTDYSIFRPSQNVWFNNRSSNFSVDIVQFGLSQSDILTPGDFDGDGRTDIAVWRSTNGIFFVRRSSDGTFSTFNWGSPGDEPLVRDYDGDGRSDYAVARRTGGQIVWFINNSSNGSTRIEQFGLATDVAVPGDYDGDGRFDLAITRGASGQQTTFIINRSTAGLQTIFWGLGGDLAVPGDYDGDGITDVAVVRQGTPYVWYVLRSTDGVLQASTLGTKPDFTTQGDYDGDGKTDVSVWDPQLGAFNFIRSSTGATTAFTFGLNGDYPVANFDTH